MHLTVELIGSAAAIMTTGSFIPQVVKALRTMDLSAISLEMYGMFCLGVGLWTIYGIAVGSPSIFISNTVTFVLASIVFVLKVRSVLIENGIRRDD